MRSRVAVFLGLSAVVVAMPFGCSDPEWGGTSSGLSSGSGSGTGGAAGGAGTGGWGGSGGGIVLKGPQECTDYCLNYFGVCNPFAVQPCIDLYCEQSFKEGGPECQDEFKAHFGCIASWAAMSPPDVLCDTSMHSGCMYGDALYDCNFQYGCLADGCRDDLPAPNGGLACRCNSRCLGGQFLRTLCWMEGAKQVCECSTNNVPVGMCEEPQVQACDYPRPYERCCNQYFMIPF